MGAPMAAFLARGNLLFSMSHDTEPLLMNQALNFLLQKQITATM